MSVTQTSLVAYESIADGLSHRESQVYAALRSLGSASNQDLALFLGWPINCVTGRVHGLRSQGFVVSDGHKVHPLSGRTVMYWRTR